MGRLPTAVDTLLEILNIITLCNPLRIFLPLSILSVTTGVLWGLNRLLILRDGLSVGDRRSTTRCSKRWPRETSEPAPATPGGGDQSITPRISSSRMIR